MPRWVFVVGGLVAALKAALLLVWGDMLPIPRLARYGVAAGFVMVALILLAEKKRPAR